MASFTICDHPDVLCQRVDIVDHNTQIIALKHDCWLRSISNKGQVGVFDPVVLNEFVQYCITNQEWSFVREPCRICKEAIAYEKKYTLNLHIQKNETITRKIQITCSNAKIIIPNYSQMAHLYNSDIKGISCFDFHLDYQILCDYICFPQAMQKFIEYCEHEKDLDSTLNHQFNHHLCKGEPIIKPGNNLVTIQGSNNELRCQFCLDLFNMGQGNLAATNFSLVVTIDFLIIANQLDRHNLVKKICKLNLRIFYDVYDSLKTREDVILKFYGKRLMYDRMTGIPKQLLLNDNQILPIPIKNWIDIAKNLDLNNYMNLMRTCRYFHQITGKDVIDSVLQNSLGTK